MNANIINHIGLVLDASGSMSNHKDSLIKSADEQIKYLAERSKELDQETRISVWTFSYSQNIKCVVWDKDVLRLPSVAPYYHVGGLTAFIDATLRAIDDLSMTPEKYGNHSFLLYVLTDGHENASVRSAQILADRLAGLPDNWTVATLVPNITSSHEAKKFGFPAGNVEIWNTSSVVGTELATDRIRQATDTYMLNRNSGINSTRTLFSTDSVTVNASTIKQAGLHALGRDDYMLIPVPRDMDIKTFTEECGVRYITGRGYYELSKTETIQPDKNVAVVERGPSGKVYVGHQARQLVNLPDMSVRVKPNHNQDYAIYIQSTSTNRKLKVGTKYLYIKNPGVLN